jgi:hypothetical protein
MPAAPSPRLTAGLALLAAGLLAACDASPAPTWTATVDTLANGAVVVRSPESGRWTVERPWTTELDLRIGSLDGDGPDVFGRVAALEVDDAGRIYVLDSQAAEVRVFDREGTVVRVLGGRGAGPGELGNAMGLAWGPDGHLWVVDSRNARYTAFDTAGAFIAAQRRRTSGAVMPWPGGLDPEGRVLDVALARDPAGGIRTTILHVHPDFLSADTVRLPEFEAERFAATVATPSGQAYYEAPVPFTPALVWHFDRRGYLWHAATAPYRIVKGTLAGDTIRITERDYTAEPVSAADRAGALDRLRPMTDLGISVDPGRVPAEKPAFEAFFVDDDGYLYVEPPRAYPGEDEPAVMAALDVFDPDGYYLGRLDLALPLFAFTTPVVRGGAIYGVHLDEMHVASVVRLRLDGR